MTKVELIKDLQVYFDYLTSDKINMLDARFVSDEMIEIHYENENFIAPKCQDECGHCRMFLYELIQKHHVEK